MKSRSAWPSCGRHQAVREHAARLRHAVDLVADVGHLLRRHHRFLGIGPGRRGDETDRRLAVEEDFLDHVVPTTDRPCVPLSPASFGFSRRELWRSPSSPCLLTPLAGRLRVGRVVAGADVVQLHVEDEERRRRVRSWKAAGSAASTGSTSKNRPNTAFMASSDAAMPPLVRRKSRRLSPSRGASRPAAARMRCSTSLLRRRLRQRRELLVGDEPRRERRLGAKPLAHARTDPERVAIPRRHDGFPRVRS